MIVETDEDGNVEYVPETEEDMETIREMRERGEIDTSASFGDE